ncbi:MAG: hypothetical protein GEU75_14300 [Dehalococcoidia bacterium]|nr:hypothetical protein [Dehalococcoidia bacterium]
MTEPTLTALEQPAEDAAKQRERSTIGFPYNDLHDGIAVARAVHELGDRCGHDQLITPLGYSTVDNGSYSLRLAGARHFGLINFAKDGATLTPLGHRIVDPQQEERGRADAFLSVPLYRKLYDEYKGKSLPPTNIGLEAVLVGYGVAAKQKDKARQVLQRSADQAGFFYQGRDRLVLPAIANRPLETPGQTPPAPPPDPKGKDDGSGGGGPIYPTLIKGMLEKLPVEGGSWSKSDRDQWVKAMELILDMVYALEADPPSC